MPNNQKSGPEIKLRPWMHLLLLAALLGMAYLFYAEGPPTSETRYAISYSQFKTLIQEGRVEKVLLAGETASGQLFDAAPSDSKVN